MKEHEVISKYNSMQATFSVYLEGVIRSSNTSDEQLISLFIHYISVPTHVGQPHCDFNDDERDSPSKLMQNKLIINFIINRKIMYHSFKTLQLN